MVDLHTHILPGIDDGAKCLEEALQMCRVAFQDGIRSIVATPHIGKFPNSKEVISKKAEELKEKLNANRVNIDLFIGSDLQLTPDIFTLIENRSVVTINNSRYLLLDIPHSLLPPNIELITERLIERGVVPLIGHPERCLQIQEDLGVLYAIVKLGAVVQITASSITGGMGTKARDTVYSILRHDLAHVISTDTHGLNTRPPVLSEAVNNASGIIGREKALAMVTTIPQDIIGDRPLLLPKPKKP